MNRLILGHFLRPTKIDVKPDFKKSSRCDFKRFGARTRAETKKITFPGENIVSVSFCSPERLLNLKYGINGFPPKSWMALVKNGNNSKIRKLKSKVFVKEL